MGIFDTESVDQLAEKVESQSSPETSGSDLQSSEPTKQEVADAIAELDKMEKFKFEGQEWTPKDLKAAILRQKDYTQKTQTLAEERKALETERGETKYYENLYADLRAVKNDPSLASQFISLYPEKFHGYLKEVLSEAQASEASRQQEQQSQPKEQYRQSPQDFETLTKLNKMERFIHDQETAKNEAVIKGYVDQFSKKYEDAIPEVAIARVYENYMATGKTPTPQQWEEAFKSVDSQIKEKLNSRYSDLVKKQTDANKKARDVESGGGTVGRAPAKFANLGEVTKHAISQLTGR